MDHEGRVVSSTPAAEKTFGYSQAEDVGEGAGGDFIIPPSLRESHRTGTH